MLSSTELARKRAQREKDSPLFSGGFKLKKLINLSLPFHPVTVVRRRCDSSEDDIHSPLRRDGAFFGLVGSFATFASLNESRPGVPISRAVTGCALGEKKITIPPVGCSK